jgi:D-alanyl-D-alanine carboxypeptidase
MYLFFSGMLLDLFRHRFAVFALLFAFVFIFLALLQCVPVAASAAEASPAKVSPISSAFCEDMKNHKTLTNHGPVGCERLASVKFSYFGFDGRVHDDGEMIVLDAVAARVARIFDRLLQLRFPLAKARPINRYDGDDDASMADNNTSSFNDRPVAGGTSLSMHAYGLAIDLNPVQNPFLEGIGATHRVSPDGGKAYLNRADIRPGMAEQVIDVFADNGFLIWGGDWHNPIDYQHFQLDRDMAEQMARLSSSAASAVFEKRAEQYRRCRQSGKNRTACHSPSRT